MKRKSLLAILVVFVLITPVSAVSFERTSFIHDGVEVFVEISADVPWSSPFTANEANLTLSVVPQTSNVSHVNISEVSLIVNKYDSSDDTYQLISAESNFGSPLVTGNAFVNYSTTFEVTGNSAGAESYFALLVVGNYRNGSSVTYFQAVSQEGLIGPFAIRSSLQSPIVYVGILLFVFFTFVIIAGLYGVKKSRSPVRRRRLLDD
ncbi:MAG: hypothetical protein ACXADL_02860 [Candidatus Thorarchaeota archaeon]